MHVPPARPGFLGTTMLSCFQFLFGDPTAHDPPVPPATCTYHDPPPGASADYYSDNPSVFGKILNGELPSRNYRESDALLAFRDRTPKAKFHALVVPKRYVKHVYSLTPDDASMVRDMRQMGLALLEEHEPRALAANDYILCFHIPPFYSVDHLHMHVLAPASEMGFLNRYGKFRCGTRWCIGALEVIEQLKEGQAAVPYKQQLF